jgi:hypothetical protein
MSRIIAAIALAFHLLEMVRDAIDFRGRLRDDLRRMVRRDRRFFGGFSCLVGGIFGTRRRRLGSCGSRFGLLCALLIARRAASGCCNGERGCEQD